MCLYTFLSTFIFQEQFRHIDLPTHKENSFSMRVIYYLQEHVETNLTLKDLADISNIRNLTFPPYSRKKRVLSHQLLYTPEIQKACQYIELTDMKLNEIAMRLGFEEQVPIFPVVFTKVMGISPSILSEKRSR